MASSPFLEWVEALQGISTVEVQLSLSAGVLISALILARFLAPVTARAVKSTFDRTMAGQGVTDGVGTVRAVLPWWISIRTVVWVLQLTVVGIAGIALLAIWGQIDVALAVLDIASLSLPMVVQAVFTLFVFVVAYVAMNILRSWLSTMTDRSNQFTQHQEEVAYRVLQLVMFSAVGLVLLSLWGVDLGGLLIGAGFLGIVAGMAAQHTLGSLIAGFVLMFSRPFEIGDWVEIGDREGIVTGISIVNTRMQNFDGEYVILPNDVVSNSTIVNRSKKGRLRIRVDVGIDYEVDPERAQSVAEETLKSVDELLTVPRPQAMTKRLADSSIVLELRFWIDKPSARRRAKATSAAIRAVKEAFESAEIKIPYPQREVSDRAESSGFRVADTTPPAEN